VDGSGEEASSSDEEGGGVLGGGAAALQFSSSCEASEDEASCGEFSERLEEAAAEAGAEREAIKTRLEELGLQAGSRFLQGPVGVNSASVSLEGLARMPPPEVRQVVAARATPVDVDALMEEID
jgi:hypothetical protein